VDPEFTGFQILRVSASPRDINFCPSRSLRPFAVQKTARSPMRARQIRIQYYPSSIGSLIPSRRAVSMAIS
jgi:hypothetical protein